MIFYQHTERCGLMQLRCVRASQSNKGKTTARQQLLDASTLRLCARVQWDWGIPRGPEHQQGPQGGQRRAGQFLIFRCDDTYWDAFPSLQDVPGHFAITQDKARYLKMGFRKVSVLSWESPWLVNKKPWAEWLGNICISLWFATWNSCQIRSSECHLSENWWFFLQFPFQRTSSTESRA